jgi:ATP-dependent Clp protease ATP-binding subunit ClpA
MRSKRRTLINILLQIMDHGKLTDHNGKQVDFRNVILIMTSNAGAADMARAAYGFTRSKREGDDMEAISRMFAPEFRNRLDAVISFGHLPKQVIRQVVDKFIAQLEAQLADRAVTIELTDEAREWLAENGYDEQMGARPMGRLIQQTIKTPLADEVLFGRLKNGGAVRVVVVASATTGLKVLGFEFPEGPITPKPEKDVRDAAKTRAKGGAKSAKATSKPKPSRKKDGGSDMAKFLPPSPNTEKTRSSGVRTVPKVPLIK